MPESCENPRTTAVLRLDKGELLEAEETPEGWLKVPARVARAGVYEYLNADGTVRRELRTPEQVFAPESLASFALRPVTDDHPWSESPPLLTPKNARQYQRGSVSEVVRRDGEFVEATLMITDSDLIAKIRSGVHEVSAGYLADTVWEAGEWEGQPYDCRQENIRANHVAIVKRGRAGEEVRLRLDSSTAVSIGRIGEVTEHSERTEERMGAKVRIAGVDYEVAEQVAQAVTKLQADHEEQIGSLRREHGMRLDSAAKCPKCDATLECPKCGKAKADAAAALSREAARADMAEARVKELEQARADAADPKRIAERVQVRVALEAQAREHLGPEVKLDGLEDQAVKRLVLAKLNPEMKLEGKDGAYVDSAYDYAMASAGRKGLATLREVTGPRLDGQGAPSQLDARAARARMEEYHRELWRGGAKS